jgi:hypothetical protein
MTRGYLGSTPDGGIDDADREPVPPTSKTVTDLLSEIVAGANSAAERVPETLCGPIADAEDFLARLARIGEATATKRADLHEAVEESKIADPQTLAVIVRCLEAADIEIQANGLGWGWFIQSLYDKLIAARTAIETPRKPADLSYDEFWQKVRETGWNPAPNDLRALLILWESEGESSPKTPDVVRHTVSKEPQ